MEDGSPTLISIYFESLRLGYTIKTNKPPAIGVLAKRFSENIYQIYSRTAICQSAISCNFIKIALRHGCSPVNLLHIFRVPFPKKTYARLLRKLYKTLRYLSWDMLNFDFLGKGLALVYPRHFVYDFSGNMFLMLYFIK